MVRKFSPEKPYKKAVESFFEETAKEEKSCTSSPVLEEIRDDKSQAQQEPQGEERDDEKKRKKERPPKSMPMFHLFQTVHERGLAMLSMRIVSDVFFAICRHKFSESFRRSFGIDIVYAVTGHHDFEGEREEFEADAVLDGRNFLSSADIIDRVRKNRASFVERQAKKKEPEMSPNGEKTNSQS